MSRSNPDSIADVAGDLETVTCKLEAAGTVLASAMERVKQDDVTGLPGRGRRADRRRGRRGEALDRPGNALARR